MNTTTPSEGLPELPEAVAEALKLVHQLQNAAYSHGCTDESVHCSERKWRDAHEKSDAARNRLEEAIRAIAALSQPARVRAEPRNEGPLPSCLEMKVVDGKAHFAIRGWTIYGFERSWRPIDLMEAVVRWGLENFYEPPVHEGHLIEPAVPAHKGEENG